MDRCLRLVALLLLVPQGAGAADNCPFITNPSQADVGGVGSAGPDGIGDDCQCGDPGHDGRVQIDDVVRILRVLNLQLPPLPKPEKCSVTGGPLDCDGADVDRIRDALAGLAVLDQVCAPATGTPAPSLLSSVPAQGATDVPRTEWLQLEFMSAASGDVLGAFELSCGSVPADFTARALQPPLLVVNPTGELPGGSACVLSWPGPTGTEQLGFSSAAAGPPATVLYDRTDPALTPPVPDDFWLTDDAGTATGVRLDLPNLDVVTVGAILLNNALLGEANLLDGFSPIASLVVELSDAPDPASLPATAAESLDPLASVGLYDVTPGSPDRGDRVPFLLQQRSDVVPGAPPVTGALGAGTDTTHFMVFGGGFTFPFYGVERTSVYVNSNGNLTFGAGDTTFNPAIPDGVVQGLPRISPLFVDLNAGAGASFEIYANQFADRFEVTWHRVPEFLNTGENNLRVVLHDDGVIEFRFVGVTANGVPDISVALTPGGTPPIAFVDFTTAPFSTGAGEAIIENFSGSGTFDLDQRVVTYTPNGGGGYDVSLAPATGLDLTHTLLLFPSIALEPERQYGLVVSRRALVDPSRPLDPSGFFAQALGPASGGEPPEVPAVRALASDVLDAVAQDAALPVPADDVALAVRLSVRSTVDIPSDLLAIKAQVLADPIPAHTITSVVADPNPDIAAIVSGTWTAPEWRTLPGNLLTGQSFARDVAGAPLSTGNKQVVFTLVLPAAAATAPVPLLMYQHGSGGDPASEVPAIAAQEFAANGIAVIGFQDVLNRDVCPTSGGGPIVLVGVCQASATLSALVFGGQMPDFFMQTYGEQLAFVRMIDDLVIDVLPIGAPDSNPEIDIAAPLTYMGISQGAIHGNALLPFTPELRAAALVVGGSRIAETLIHQGSELILAELRKQIPELRPEQVWVGFALFQSGLDVQDAHNYAPFLYLDPVVVPGGSRRASVLVTEGLGDSLVPNNASESLVHGMGIPHLEPVQRAIPLAAPVTGPLTANIDFETTGAFYQYVPSSVPGAPVTPGCVFEPEGHFCPVSAAEAIAQREEFFATAIANPVCTISDPLP